MTWHPSDEDLILLFYGELKPPAAHRIESHLAACGVCQAAWSELGDTLRLVDAAEVPEAPVGFERVVWARISQALPEPTRWSWRQLVPLTALGALVLAAALVSRGPTASRSIDTPEQGALAAATNSDDTGRHSRVQRRVLFTALDDHLEQTELLLIELLNAPANGHVELVFEREAADDLVASGRLYRATAEETGDRQFALVLEDIERVLVEVARSPARIERTELESLRGWIGDEDLLFKVRAAASEVRARQQNLMTVSEGPL